MKTLLSLVGKFFYWSIRWGFEPIPDRQLGAALDALRGLLLATEAQRVTKQAAGF